MENQQKLKSKLKKKEDRQALLKAKYCPRVAAVSRTQKNTQKTDDLDLLLMTLKFNTVIEVLEIHVHAKNHQNKLSAAVHELSLIHI